MGFGHFSTETNGLSQQGSAAAQPCHCKSLGAMCSSWQTACGKASGSFWGVGLCSHSASAVSHDPKRMCLTSPWERVGISSLPSIPCPPPLSQNNSGKTNWGEIKSDNNVSASARKRTSPTLMRTVWVMITNNSNKERETTDSLSVGGCSPVKESCFPGARVLLWTLHRRCHGHVSSPLPS